VPLGDTVCEPLAAVLVMFPLVHVRVAALVLVHVTVALPPRAILFCEIVITQLATPEVEGDGDGDGDGEDGAAHVP
jgi:hypothetical protein